MTRSVDTAEGGAGQGAKRLAWLSLGFLLIIAASVAAVVLTPEADLSTGVAHPDFPVFRIGGDGARFASIAWPVIIFQTATLFLVATLVAMGISARNRTPGFWGWLTVAAAVTIGMWLAVIITYLDFLENGATGTLFGYPLPSALSVFGIWIAGLIYMLIYVIGFRRFIYTPEDEAAFEALVRETREARGEGGAP